MKCFNCGKNEADSRFVVNYMGNLSEVHLCRECLEQIQNYAGRMMRLSGGEGAPFTPGPGMEWGFAPPSSGHRRIGVTEERKDDFPMDAGEDIRERRKMSSLKARLEDAIGREDYEEAARLRDEIYFASQKATVSVSE